MMTKEGSTKIVLYIHVLKSDYNAAFLGHCMVCPVHSKTRNKTTEAMLSITYMYMYTNGVLLLPSPTIVGDT